MTNFHSAIRNVLAEVDSFFSETLRSEKVSKKASLHKEKILDLIFNLRHDYPELLPKIAEFSRSDDEFIPDFSARELKNITKAGFLGKRRKKDTLFQRGSYQRRYCVIQNHNFYYYVHPTDKKQAGAFQLKGYKFRKAPYLPDDGNKKDLSFELVCPGKRTYQFLAEISQDITEWKDAVQTGSGETKTKTADKNNDISFENTSDDDDAYYVAVNSDDEILRSPQNDVDVGEGESYEEVTTPTEQEHDKNDNHQTDKAKPPLLPKSPTPHKKSLSDRPPQKPPVLPKQYRRKQDVQGGDGEEEYVECESKRTDDEDSDNDYTDPVEFGRNEEDDSDEDYEVMTRKQSEGQHRNQNQIKDKDAYNADAHTRSEVTSDASGIYQDASSGQRP